MTKWIPLWAFIKYVRVLQKITHLITEELFIYVNMEHILGRRTNMKGIIGYLKIDIWC